MRYRDTSALVPLVIEQPASRIARELLMADCGIVVWWGTAVECWSAFAHLRREGRLTLGEEEGAGAMLDTLRHAWFEVLPGEEVRSHAAALLRRHPLRAADALQLAAALVWAGSPASGEIVVLDQRLATAARLEGLTARP